MENLIFGAFATLEGYREGDAANLGRTVYDRCTVTALCSAKAQNPRCTVALLTNAPVPEPFRSQLTGGGVEIWDCPFDAYRVPGSPGSIEEYHNIHVVYTKEAETADMFIERVTHEIGRNRRVRVATSDGMEQVIILGHGALRVSARMFHQEVQDVEKEIKRYIQGEA